MNLGSSFLARSVSDGELFEGEHRDGAYGNKPLQGIDNSHKTSTAD
ncbi:hypothetical protein IAD21_00853 [Abditibacteriota bacterium]|nr:hypothetical protein IAD21_00853 [Abditibacteriota bacterium]